jgi:hypothetical protein
MNRLPPLPFLIGAIAPLALLSACGSSEDDGKRGTDISINAKDPQGDVAIKADGQTGKVSVNVPGFNASVSLPKVMLEDGDFDIDGVKLYPGSKVTSVNVNANSDGENKKAVVTIAFTSPAEPEKVRAWFAKGFADSDVKAKATTTGFAGTTDDAGSFSMTLTPSGAATTGVVEIIDDDGWSGSPAQPTPPKPPSPPPVS